MCNYQPHGVSQSSELRSAHSGTSRYNTGNLWDHKSNTSKAFPSVLSSRYRHKSAIYRTRLPSIAFRQNTKKRCVGCACRAQGPPTLLDTRAVFSLLPSGTPRKTQSRHEDLMVLLRSDVFNSRLCFYDLKKIFRTSYKLMIAVRVF